MDGNKVSRCPMHSGLADVTVEEVTTPPVIVRNVIRKNSKCTYIRNDKNKRAITIMSVVSHYDNGDIEIEAAWSFRNRLDQFIKKEGKRLAKARLDIKSISHYHKFTVDTLTYKEIALEITTKILESYSTPPSYYNDLKNELKKLRG